MTDQDPFPQPQQTPPSNPDWRETRRHSGSRWAPGIVLIGLGVIFLLGNLTGFELHNWWALFILIPAFSAFARAYEQNRHGGTFDRQMRGALFAGALFTCVAVILLFDLSWTFFGPVLLIIIGGGMLLNVVLP